MKSNENYRFISITVSREINLIMDNLNVGYSHILAGSQENRRQKYTETRWKAIK